MFIYLFISDLFSDVFGSSDFVVSSGRMISEELKSVWKEVVLVSFRLLCQNVPGRIEEYHEKSQSK
jgi:hypothetical protein